MTQLLGRTKLRILQTIAESPQHGYVLSKKLGVSVSSIYDHLKDLERSQLIKAELEESRRLYSITKSGELLLKALKVGMTEKTDMERKR